MDKYPTVKDPGIRAFLEEGERLYPEGAVNFSLAEQRIFYDRYCAHFRKPRPASVKVEDFSVGAISCRRYAPPNAGPTKLLYLHGGGFILGGLESHDDICAELAEGTGLETIAVQYRLAPEHRFPAAFDDCWAVLTSNFGPWIVAGDSAGGNLAAALCIKARDEDFWNIAGQVLIYPGLGGDVTKGSYITQANAPGLSTKDMLYYHETYGGGDHHHAMPLKSTTLHGLPKAFLVAAGLDPLHDDCFNYAEKLEENGVSVQVRDEPLLIHSFLRARHMSEPARQSFAAIIAAIRRFAA
jgi:acetyl esterase